LLCGGVRTIYAPLSFSRPGLGQASFNIAALIGRQAVAGKGRYEVFGRPA